MEVGVNWRLVCRWLLGFAFVASALLKLFSADAFATYIYGMELFPLSLSAVVARLVIGFEFTLGVLLISRLCKKWVDGLVLLTLLGFSLYLLVLLLKGDDGNCYCFGDVIEFSPGESLLKNAVFFALLYFGQGVNEWKWHWTRWFVPSLFVLSVALCFVLKWPDSFSSTREVSYRDDAFKAYMEKLDSPKDWRKGRRLVAFVSTSCPHCKLLTRKIHAAFSRNAIADTANIWVVFDPKNKYDAMLASGEFNVPSAQFLDSRIFKITEGVLPLVLLLEDGEVVDKMSNRTFSEDKLIDFFKK